MIDGYDDEHEDEYQGDALPIEHCVWITGVLYMVALIVGAILLR